MIDALLNWWYNPALAIVQWGGWFIVFGAFAIWGWVWSKDDPR